MEYLSRRAPKSAPSLASLRKRKAKKLKYQASGVQPLGALKPPGEARPPKPVGELRPPPLETVAAEEGVNEDGKADEKF